ncbi:peptide transporter family 1 [Arctopsyche grandis]|uniref:peptide transporter family 1 n=1 Tax=Arctopsyche grandis TaxID=121162 RepID=UPI00406D87E3
MSAIEDSPSPKKYSYPRSIGFIISNEFCERFSFYGMKTILSIYLAAKLAYSDDDAVVVYHVFTMLVYFFPIFGAMIADSWLGRFNTIVYLSIVYSLGNILISVTSIPSLGIPPRAFTIIGLLLVAVGTGGIKPCVSAFGGDQFKMPEQGKQLATFFSLFYFAINAGSFISTFVTPILRQDVHCFGDEDCYPLAFGVPGILMITSIVIFICGKYMYVIKKPTGNVLVQVFKCIGHALSRRRKVKKEMKVEHWLDYADDEFDYILINDIKAVLKVLLLFIPLPVFWALFDQQGSRWTFQATRMNGAIGSFILKPDQMQVVNPLLILLFIPLFEVAIYPALRWCRVIRKPLDKMILGGMLAAIAFIISGIVELELEKTYPVLPTSGITHLRMYNGYDCKMTVTANLDNENQKFEIEALSAYENKNIQVNGQKTVSYSITGTNCSDFTPIENNNFRLKEQEAISYFVYNGSIEFEDNSDKSSNGFPIIRVLKNFDTGETLRFVDPSTEIEELVINNNSIERYDIKPSMYNVYIGQKLVIGEQNLELGGVYTIILNKDKNGEYKHKAILITPPNSVHMLWLLPQYIIITMGEVMFSITGLEFSFTQAPSSMKSVLTAAWLLTVAFGNLIVVIVAETKGFSRQSDEFFLFAGLMVADMVIFLLMTLKYKYVSVENDSVSDNDTLNLSETPNEKKGIDNQAVISDEKPN